MRSNSMLAYLLLAFLQPETSIEPAASSDCSYDLKRCSNLTAMRSIRTCKAAGVCCRIKVAMPKQPLIRAACETRSFLDIVQERAFAGQTDSIALLQLTYESTTQILAGTSTWTARSRSSKKIVRISRQTGLAAIEAQIPIRRGGRQSCDGQVAACRSVRSVLGHKLRFRLWQPRVFRDQRTRQLKPALAAIPLRGRLQPLLAADLRRPHLARHRAVGACDPVGVAHVADPVGG